MASTKDNSRHEGWTTKSMPLIITMNSTEIICKNYVIYIIGKHAQADFKIESMLLIFFVTNGLNAKLLSKILKKLTSFLNLFWFLIKNITFLYIPILPTL